MNWVYVPVQDKELMQFAERLVFRDEARAYGSTVAQKYRLCAVPEPDAEAAPPLTNVADNDKVWVVLHGRSSTANQVGGLVDGRTQFMSALELASRLQRD